MSTNPRFFQTRYLRLLAILISIFCLGLLQLVLLGANLPSAAAPESVSNAFSVNTIEVIERNDLRLEIEQDDPVLIIGEACGGGTVLPPWTICLHGTVYDAPSTGEPTPLSDVEVEISYKGESVSGFTFVHAGGLTPTFGIDISPIKPTYLEPVTITTRYDGNSTSRLVTLYPDFRSMSQQIDIYLEASAAFDPLVVWGTVIDYGTLGAAEGVTVTAEYGSPRQSVVKETLPFGDDPTPVFRFTMADLPGLTSSDLITLTTIVDDDLDQRVVTFETGEPVQTNLITGWKCDDYDPLPRSRKGFAFPRSRKGFAFPNVVCVYGVGLLNGSPREGLSIEVDVGETVFEGVTGLPQGEVSPRYGIGILGQEALVGRPMTVTAIYNNLSTSWVTDTLTLDPLGGIEVNLNILDAAALNDILSPNSISQMLTVGDDLWVATYGGLLHYTLDPEPRLVKRYTTANSDIATNTPERLQVDHLGRLWVEDIGQAFQVFDPDTDIWQMVDPSQNTLDGHTVVTNTQQVWYVSTAAVGFRLDPSTNLWEEMAPETIIIEAVAVAPNGESWIADRYDGLRRYNPLINSWSIYNTANSDIPSNDLRTVAVDLNGDVWFSVENGFSLYRFNPQNEIWTTWTLADVPEVGQAVITDIFIDENGILTLGLGGGVATFDPVNDVWTRIDLSSSQYPNWQISHLALDSQGGFYLGYNYGVVHVGDDGTWQSLAILDDGPLARQVYDVEEADDGTIWYATDAGFSIFDPATRIWAGYNAINTDLIIDRIEAILFVPNHDEVWLSAYSRLAVFNRETKSIQQIARGENETQSWDIGSVSELIYDEGRNGIWIGAFDGLTYRDLNPDSVSPWQLYLPPGKIGFNDGSVLGLVLDQDGNVWISTQKDGFYRFDPETLAWDHFSIDSNIPEISSNSMGAIAVNSQGTVWVGMNHSDPDQQGLVRYEPEAPEGEQFTLFNRTNSPLLGTSIAGIVIDQYDRLWISTTSGVFHLDTLDMSWKLYDIEIDSNLLTNFSQNLSFGRNNDLWIPSAYGVLHWYMPIQDADIETSISGASKLVGQNATELEFAMTLTNQGQSAGDVSIGLSWPSTMTLSSLTVISPNVDLLSGSSLVGSGMEERWDVGVIPAGSRVELSGILTGDLNDSAGTTHHLIGAAYAGARESRISNNTSTLSTRIVEPNRADLAITLSGPPVLVSDQFVTYTLLVENLGSLDALNTNLSMAFPTGLEYVSADPLPSNLSPLIWSLGEISSAEGALPQSIKIRAQTGTIDSETTSLPLSADIGTTTEESILSNNEALADIPVSTIDAKTLILISPQRLSNRYGTSNLLDRVYELAAHPTVNGLVLDLDADQQVSQAFAIWDSSPSDWRAANAVAEEIKGLMAVYQQAYPDIESVVMIGGDDMVPYYRVLDRNPTMWHERTYVGQLDAPSTVYHALAADMILTDDFYADQQPSAPNSPFWPDQSPFYLPDIALGRLVETPAEIITTIDIFLGNDGIYQFDEAIVGGDSILAQDLVDAQCVVLQSLGYALTCTTDEDFFETDYAAQAQGMSWTAWHSSHFGMGLFGDALALDAIDEFMPFSSLNATIGCHAGLSVPDMGGNLDRDLVQAVAGKGGISIGATAYTYGSFSEIGFTEQLYVDILDQLRQDDVTIGEAVLAAKQGYYAGRGWFDLLDEKTLLAVTTYGLPMSRLDLPAPPTQSRQLVQDLQNPVTVTENAVSLTISSDDYVRSVGEEGDYFAYQGQIHTQHLLPIQPAFETDIPFYGDDGQETILKDFVIRSASFVDIEEFDPLVDESFAMGTAVTRNNEPTTQFVGWDRELPVGINLIADQSDSATLDFTLGLYNSDTAVERLVVSLELELMYGQDSDDTLPLITSVELFQDNQSPYTIAVQGSDANGIAEIVVLYEQPGVGWRSSVLDLNGGRWQGEMPIDTSRYLIQVVDANQNVSRTAWVSDFTSRPPLQSTATSTPVPVVTPQITPDPTVGIPSPTPVVDGLEQEVELYLPSVRNDR